MSLKATSLLKLGHSICASSSSALGWRNEYKDDDDDIDLSDSLIWDRISMEFLSFPGWRRCCIWAGERCVRARCSAPLVSTYGRWLSGRQCVRLFQVMEGRSCIFGNSSQAQVCFNSRVLFFKCIVPVTFVYLTTWSCIHFYSFVIICKIVRNTPAVLAQRLAT